jgi:predicted nucleotidyltransferase
MKRPDLIIQKRTDILRLASRHGAHNVRLFGSAARGEADALSDIDILVDLEPGRSLLDLGGLLMDLQELLGCPVDVVTEKGLRPRIRERVLREAVSL